MQSSSQPDEVMGNPEAHHIIKFEYCGGWGYRRHVLGAIEQIEKVAAGTFKYTIYRDPGVTGRLEATLYLNASSDAGEGIVLHSKAASKTYIS